jgi:hypothetical protein
MDITRQYLIDKLDELSCDQAIFSDRIYRKINNSDNTYSIYRLDFKNNGFIWEKIYNFVLSEGHECISFDNLVFHKGAGFTEVRVGLTDSNDCITIYVCPTDGIATKEMIYKDDNLLVWNMFYPDMELDPNLGTDSLLNLPTHVDLIQESMNNSSNGDENECQNDNYDFLDDFEPLHGWDNLLDRSSNTEDNISLVDDLEKDNDMCDNFKYPEHEDYTDNIKDNVTRVDEEYRIDPYDGELYSKSEFLEYYGGETEWNHQSPKNLLLREEYYKFTGIFGHLSDKKFIYLFKKYEKTFSQ